jgi:ribosomal 30S subunit maturation factor RimM
VEIPEEEARELNRTSTSRSPGLTLVDAEGRERGVVTDVYEGGGGILLNVKRPDGKVRAAVRGGHRTTIDLSARRIVVSLPEGLDDLDTVEE